MAGVIQRQNACFPSKTSGVRISSPAPLKLKGVLAASRTVLLFVMKSGMDQDEACLRYLVSDDLLTYRLDITGVTAQMKRRK